MQCRGTAATRAHYGDLLLRVPEQIGDMLFRVPVFSAKTPLTLSLSKCVRLLLLPLTLTLSSCAAPSNYMGLSLTRPELPESVRTLAGRAMAGDKQAQLDLGIAFEEGQQVPRDWNKAKKLYRMAAATTGGTIWVYSPPVNSNDRGRVIPINEGPVVEGLSEARSRLNAGVEGNQQ